LLSADEIKKLLATKHREDVFVTECRTGPSWSADHVGILDAWSMPKSWSHPAVTGYEVKVSRHDFVSDNKWQAYLPYCNLFYFVCPNDKVIKLNEVPETAGLYYVSSTGTKLFCKKKAPWRDVKIPEEIFRYLLMSRVKIERQYYNKESKRQYWENWVKDKEADYHFGHTVSKSIRQTIKKRIDDVEKKNSELEEKIRGYDRVISTIKGLGLNPDDVRRYGFDKKLSDRLKELANGSPNVVLDKINEASALLNDLKKSVQEIREEAGKCGSPPLT